MFLWDPFPHGNQHGVREWGDDEMKKYRVLKGVAAVGAALLVTSLAASPASAATETFYSGPACHNVMRYELGTSLSRSRTGIGAEGGSSAGTSQITVYFGGFTNTAWAGSTAVDGPRSNGAGKFKIFFAGAVSGECAGQSYGRLRGISATRAMSEELQIESGTVDGWDMAAFSDPVTGGVTVTAEFDGYTFTSVFSEEQVESGEAQMLISEIDGESHLVTFDPSADSPLEVSLDETLPDPTSVR